MGFAGVRGHNHRALVRHRGGKQLRHVERRASLAQNLLAGGILDEKLPLYAVPKALTMLPERTRWGRNAVVTDGANIERYHRSMKNRILLDNYYLPGQLEQSIAEFVRYYNNCRYHESLDNLTPADVYFARGKAILERREKIKRKTIEQRRRLHQQAIAA